MRFKVGPAGLMGMAAVLFAVVACGAPAAGPAGALSATVTAVPPSPATATGAHFPLTVTGDDGRSLVLAQQPRRIISLSPGHTETLFAIGAGDALVGVDNYSDYPPQARQLPQLSYSNVDLEQVVALHPDLVIVPTHQKKAIPELDRLKLPNLFLSEAQNLDALLARIIQIGDLTGHRGEAERLAGDMRRRLDAVAAKLEGVQGPLAFYELGPELFTVGPETFIGDMLTRLKLKNIAAGSGSAFPRLSQEQVLASDPEVILLGDAGAGETPESVAARPGWKGVRAVRNHRVIVVANRDIVHRPGPRVADGIDMLAKALYPDRFP